TTNDKPGRQGADLRRACGDMQANAESLIYHNEVAAPLRNCFDQARITGGTLDEFDRIRAQVLTATPKMLSGKLMQDACIMFALQQMGMVIAATDFTSREDVDKVKSLVIAAFRPAEEVVADEMASTLLLAMYRLHAAIMFHLYATARPLPRMLNYQFAAVRPS